MRTFFQKLTRVGLRDYKHLLLFVLALLPAKCLRRKRPKMWLICEYSQEARDNAYWLFRYLRQQHTEVDVVYAIDPTAEDYQKVAPLGETVAYGTLKHWIYYLAADINISTHKGGKPNAAVCYLLEVYGIWKNKRVFLQHGITKDLAELFFYKNTKMRLFICGAKPEYDFVSKHFGYPEGYVAYTGFPRFDNLKHEPRKDRFILVAPTWRSWLYEQSSDPYQNSTTLDTEHTYFSAWLGLLKSDRMAELLRRYGYKLVFFPHRNMTESFSKTMTGSELVEYTDWKSADLQVLMKQASCLITDYSSVAMDFAYMSKPVIYYQFDYEQYRAEQLAEGYFSYQKHGFGPVFESEEQVLDQVEAWMQQQFIMPYIYEQRLDTFFALRDQNNCQRVYEAILKL